MIFLRKTIKYITKITPTKNGFAILFAVLISSVVLAVSLGIASVASKELSLSAIAKEGGKALFAADTGIECGLYNDVKLNAFGSGNIFGNVTAVCGDNDSIDVGENVIGGYFEFEQTLFGDMCARVKVYKNLTFPGDEYSYTRVEALGYNHECSVIDPISGSNPPNNLVERALRATYENTSSNVNGSQIPSQFQVTQQFSSQTPQSQIGQVNSQNLSNGQINTTQPSNSQTQNTPQSLNNVSNSKP